MSNLYYIKTNDINDYNNKAIKMEKLEYLNGIAVNDYVLVNFDNTNDNTSFMSLWNVSEIEDKESKFKVVCNEIYSDLKIKLADLQSLKIFKISKELLSLAGKPNKHQFFKFETVEGKFEDTIKDKNSFLKYTRDENNHRKICVFDSEQLALDSGCREDIRLYKDGETFNCIKDSSIYCENVISAFDPKKFYNGADAGNSNKKNLYKKLCGCSKSGEEIKMDQGFYDLFCSAKDGNGGKLKNKSPKSILQPINSEEFDLERCLEENFGHLVEGEDSKNDIYADNCIVYIYYKGCIKYMGNVVGINTLEAEQFDDSKYLKKQTVNKSKGRRVLIKIKKYLKDSELTKERIEQENLKIGIQKVGKINDETSVYLQYFFDKCSEEFKLNSAYNKIFYGVPGCGKSYYIKNVILPEILKPNNEIVKNLEDSEYVFRTIFHHSYSYTDFVGQYMPRRDSQGGNLTYEFVPKVFTLALQKAYENPDKNIVLIIEEINRGEAASIFGDLFQLLDRNEEGRSEYQINNEEIIDYLNKHRQVANSEESIMGKVLKSKKIFIPSNLYILATMNTCDQNVFALDTAFKRRWDMEEIPNNFGTDDKKFKDMYIPYVLKNSDRTEKIITWEGFVEIINNKIKEHIEGEFFGEDRQIGCYFVNKSYLCTEVDLKNKNYKNQSKKFANKIIEYLWNDVAKVNKGEWFGSKYKTLSDAISGFKKSDKELFSDKIFNDLFGSSKAKNYNSESDNNGSTDEINNMQSTEDAIENKEEDASNE